MPNSIKLDGTLNIFILVHSIGVKVKQLKSQGVNETGLNHREVICHLP